MSTPTPDQRAARIVEWFESDESHDLYSPETIPRIAREIRDAVRVESDRGELAGLFLGFATGFLGAAIGYGLGVLVR